jgi:hypothetical protein
MTDWAFDDNLFEVDSADAIDLEAFEAAMQKRTFACIRGLVSAGEMRAAHARIVERFDRSLDHPATGQSPDAVRTNFQKINLGGESRTASNDDARFFRAFYNPLWAEDVWGLRSAFLRLIQACRSTSRPTASRPTASGRPRASTSTRAVAVSSAATPTTW